MATDMSFKFQKRTFGIAPYRESWHEFEAFDGEHLIGRIVCFEAPPGSRDCWIHDLWVEPAKRRSGLGSELLRLAIETANIQQYLRLLGEFRPYDEAPTHRVEAFFNRHGFAIESDWEGTGRSVAVRLLA